MADTPQNLQPDDELSVEELEQAAGGGADEAIADNTNCGSGNCNCGGGGGMLDY
jgi:hypothetical protein